MTEEQFEAKIAIEEWMNLHKAAMDFKDSQCWTWMYDSDLFGVQNPESGEIGYCCVMGNLGELLALAVYQGPEGLETYCRMAQGEWISDPFEAMFIQKCLMASFEDRSSLDKPDLEIVKALGLKFRGRQSWPLFRSYEPGYVPWYLDRGQVQFLTVALEQAVEVALRYREDSSLLDAPADDLLLVRVPERQGEQIHWRDEWLKPAPAPPPAKIPDTVDEIRLQRIRGAKLPKKGTWEFDLFHSPMAVAEGSRPFYPMTTLLVEQKSGLVLGAHLSSLAQYWVEARDQLLQCIEKAGFIPRKILISRPQSGELLAPLAEHLGIDLVVADYLKVIDEARESLFAFLER